MEKKVYIKTWGCQMNEHDSDLLQNILKKKKYIIVKNPEISDILILNTCSIREKAQEKVFHQLGRWKKLKDKNNNIIIAVGGCVASQEGIKIFERAKFINIIFGPQTLHKLPNLLNKVTKKNPFFIDIKLKSLKKFNLNFIKTIQKKCVEYVSIIEGCNQFCSFCIVPYTRGKEISRPSKDILLEIKKLSQTGIREIILLGQNVNAYIEKKKNKIYDFSDLLLDISKIDKILRIRYVTSHPKKFTNKLIQLYQKIPKLVNFLHLPVQSGSNRILKLMKRGYTIEEYINLIYQIKKIRPQMVFSSDFIVGYPGETKKDFEKTINLIKNINFDTSFSFLYSSRPGTKASKLKDFLSLEEKKKRLYKLQKIIKLQSFQWRRRMLGTIQNVLVEGVSKKNHVKELFGKTENNRQVYFSGDSSYIGKLVKIKIIEINYNSFLKGKLL
ncbi:tRNA-2-methylthio-N(6)-dimethylallyladenosine synthase [Buchnera aphidicola (Tuberolachnus salignus)]|uniref:tRNA-2-methylthio-N(6)-dimethylallyladenosine synthase n=1 Tax=Buchnera aphidicola subsp. Tuberolachnus salignus TaxID=98804 RepID=A0A160SX47_BUCTT|nr:tRNA (N6-isopentenyl adenosine(37)-C2)-methylthiotransferase MiaB [Buchnera aphidicola]CUR53258.1 tRNA-2-methylthio-N(6)-dimethylallyladenosine synthase [Buchnera aphidicola (Tuberolachnus salignus)]